MELIGREAEVEELVGRLGDRRLVTVCGPGGIGKTALARAALARSEPGPVTVDLTTVDDEAGVFEAMAGQLGSPDFGSLLDAPDTGPLAVLVDNCEHVIDAAAEAIDQLLVARRSCRIVATSRTPLDLEDESLLVLGPLATAAADVVDPASPAMRLLAVRARDHGVDLTPDDQPVAAEICRRLDGMPLAIELAAARLRAIGMGELLSQLDREPHNLARRRFRGQASHRSVAEVVDGSYRLLEPAEQRAFVQLAVFAGPFTEDLAGAVVRLDPGGRANGEGPDDNRPNGWGEALGGLVAASLVVVDRSTSPTRYRLLHPVRAVGFELLRQSGEASAVRSRLIDEIIARTVAIGRGGPTGWRPQDLHGLLDLYDNAAASIRWLLDNDDAPDRALVLVAVLWGIVHNAHSREIHALGEVVIERWPDPSGPGWPNAAATVATCRFRSGDTARAIGLAEEALAHAGRSRSAPVLLRRVLSQSLRAEGDLEGAQAGFARAAALAEERKAHGLALEMRIDEALAMIELGNYGPGIALIEASIVRAEQLEAPINRCWGEAARAAALVRSEPGSEPARAAVRVALESARDIDYPAGLTFGLRLLAEWQLSRDETTGAAGTVAELLDELRGRGGLDELRSVLDLGAEVMRRREDPRWVDLVATARALPVTSFITPLRLATPPVETGEAAVLSTRAAHDLCRQAMQDAIDGRVSDGRVSEGLVSETEPVPGSERGLVVDAELVAEGEVWRLAFAGTTVRLRRSKGLGDLATLLAAPGHEIAAVDLAGVAVSGTADEVIDAEARRRYEERVRYLQADIDEAEAANDVGRAERSRAELDALVDQLTSAVGLGGRHRRVAGDAERARSAVTQRLRGTLRRIDDVHPKLGAHLTNSVSTGAFCCYRPHPPVRWRVEPDTGGGGG